jgi:hypothetical protein
MLQDIIQWSSLQTLPFWLRAADYSFAEVKMACSRANEQQKQKRLPRQLFKCASDLQSLKKHNVNYSLSESVGTFLETNSYYFPKQQIFVSETVSKRQEMSF